MAPDSHVYDDSFDEIPELGDPMIASQGWGKPALWRPVFHSTFDVPILSTSPSIAAFVFFWRHVTFYARGRTGALLLAHCFQLTLEGCLGGRAQVYTKAVHLAASVCL